MTPPNPDYNFAVNIEIPEFTDAVSGGVFSREISGTGQLQLGDQKYTTAVANRLTVNFSLINKQNPNAVNIAPGTNVNISLSFRNMKYVYVKGFFGDQLADVPPETLHIDAFGSALAGNANVSFADPRMDFTVVNDAGVPTNIYFSGLEAAKPGSAPIPILLNPSNPVHINFPVAMGDSALTNVTVTNTKQIIDYAPKTLSYKFTGRINEGLTSGSNFITDSSLLKVKMHVEVPLYGHASDVIMADTIELNLSDINESNIERAALKVKTVNELPLEAKIQFILTDENFVVQDVLLPADQTTLIKGSQVNGSGELQTPGSADQLIPLDKDKLQKLFAAKNLIIQARLSTSQDANGDFPDVKFKAAYRMKVNIGLQVKLKIKVDL